MGSGGCDQSQRVASDFKWVRVSVQCGPFCFMSIHLQTCCGGLKRPFLLLACLKVTFAFCVVRLQRRHQPLFSCTWNRMSIWCGVDAHMAAHAPMRALGKSSSDLIDLKSGHAGNYTGCFYMQDFYLQGRLTSTKSSDGVMMMCLTAWLPFLYVCRCLLFQGDQAYSSHF